ncbi:MAG: F0F1 ATP synthase subunit beta, partial [Bacteroidia bacterium]|nr:F0F1 ATP synthase subunit beta [Bacteroidia bacterium]
MTITTEDKRNPLNYGKIISVRGSVVDVFFENNLPPIYTLLYIVKDKEIAVEVLTQLDDQKVRGIALNPTQGLARGMLVETDGKELTVPVGKEIMGRMFDVFGNTIDQGKPLKKMEQRKIHQSPPPLAKRSTKSEVFITGIKAIDVLMPLERGGSAGLFGGAG